MTEAEINGLEGFFAVALKGRASATLRARDLKAAGYDMGLLNELLTQYRRLPASQRRFAITVQNSGDVLVASQG